MKFDRSAAADLWRNTLSQIPTTFGRLIYLASLRDQNTGGLQLADLSRGLSLDFIGVETSAQSAQGEAANALPEVTGVAEVHQAWDFLSVQQWRSIDENQMTAYGKLWVRTRELNGVIERGGAGHESSRGNNSPGVRLHDSAIHSRSETKVIRIDDQTPHATL